MNVSPPVAAVTVMLNVPCTELGVGLVESVTCTVKLYGPAVVGVPVMVPVGPTESPGGKVPLTKLHAYGGVPPVAASVVEYKTLVVAPGSGEVVVICRGAAADPPCSAIVCGVPVALSVTCRVAVRKPVAVGVNTTPITHTACAFKTVLKEHSVFPGPLKVTWKSSKSVPVIEGTPVIASA